MDPSEISKQEWFLDNSINKTGQRQCHITCVTSSSKRVRWTIPVPVAEIMLRNVLVADCMVPSGRSLVIAVTWTSHNVRQTLRRLHSQTSHANPRCHCRLHKSGVQFDLLLLWQNSRGIYNRKWLSSAFGGIFIQTINDTSYFILGECSKCWRWVRFPL